MITNEELKNTFLSLGYENKYTEWKYKIEYSKMFLHSEIEDLEIFFDKVMVDEIDSFDQFRYLFFLTKHVNKAIYDSSYGL
ncbi:hypothetical protein LC087_04035 [Bacillus carboniphilus]|uniref:Uncharacterized protein n=1 Tax=Bacillus carboniphilus TaxID=86663 RepID=A0ABY9JVE5_9BACI|nr:hypothetical protein [Bacillus carboniphilus]WLR43362.1 hypothetical protein LC087_04035 [Bacillus carboniphilus]